MTSANYIRGLFLAGTETRNSKMATRLVPYARDFQREREYAVSQ